MKKAERHLKLRQVEVFLEAAKLGKTEAARSLAITPSALFQAIADLERDLGEDVALFDRTQRGVLTPAGEAFFKEGKRLMESEQAARNAVARSREKTEAVPLRIAHTPEFAGTVSNLLHRLLELRGAVEAVEGDSEAVQRLMASNEVDVGLLYAEGGAWVFDALRSKQFGDDVTIIPLLVPGLRFIGQGLRALKDGKLVTLASLEDASFAFPWPERETAPEQRHARKAVEQYFAQNGFTPQQVMFRSNSMASVLDAIRTHGAVTIHTTLEGFGSEGASTLPLWPYPDEQSIVVLCGKGDETLNAAGKLFAEHFKTRFPRSDNPALRAALQKIEHLRESDTASLPTAPNAEEPPVPKHARSGKGKTV